MTKITMTTIKSFLKKNEGQIYISVGSRFDGSVDCVMPTEDKGFTLARKPEFDHDNQKGIQGAWFVGSSRDSLSAFEDEEFTGYRVYNCCGSFILAVKKAPRLTINCAALNTQLEA